MLEIAEPAYPLTKAALTRALMTGHGRALIHAERWGTDEVRDEILNAALDPKVYDAQCNGLGEAWLARLCTMAGLVESIVSRNQGMVRDDGWLRCALLKEFALQGHAAARLALREMCRFDEEINDLLGCSEIAEVEGEEGWIFAIDRIGERLLADKEFWADLSLVRMLDERVGEGRAMEILDRESVGNPKVAAYRKAVVSWQTQRSARPDRSPPSVEELIGKIPTSTKRIPRLSIFGKQASSDERRRIAALDHTKMSPISLENYLCCFQGSGFPEFRDEYLQLLSHPEERVRWGAHSALSHHEEPQVRQAAYEALARGEVAHFVKLLRRSGLSEDTEALLSAIGDPRTMIDDDEVHEVVGALLDLVKENGNLHDSRLVLWIYEKSPCRICRFNAVELMVDREILPQWIAAECLRDAYEDIREIAAKHLGVERSF